MLTLFSTPKPFEGHSNLIQRNALQSWRELHPGIEVILFGDDAGTAEVCRELGLRHEPAVERKADGTKSLRSIFGQAQEIACHEILCYSNCDVIFTNDFIHALADVARWRGRFLMVGRRWDLEVTEPIHISGAHWQQAILQRARNEGLQRLHYNIDYFAFPRGLYKGIPDLAIGRNWWDQWLLWSASAQGASVIDVSDVVCAVHQNHDYSYHPRGMTGVWYDERAQENFRQAGGWSHLHTIEDARFRFTPKGIVPNRFYWLAPARRRVRRVSRAMRTLARTRFWHPLLDRTRSLRHALGLKQDILPASLRRKSRRHWLDV